MLVGLGILLAGAGPAQADELVEGTGVVATATSAVEDPVGTITSTANGAVGTVTTISSGTAGSTLGEAGIGSETPHDVASSSSGSSSEGSGGSSTSSRAGASGSRGDRKTPGRSYHTRFDRLPHRAEILAERIELGRNVRANLRRLEALLSRSPALRAELARVLRSELARLRNDGLTAAERRQVRRLVRVQQALAPSVSGSSSTMGSASAVMSSTILDSNQLAGSAGTSQDASPQSEVAAAHAEGEADGPGEGSLGALPVPGGVDGRPAWLMLLLQVVVWSSILGLVAIVLWPLGRALR